MPGVWSFAASEPGPHVVLSALVHGNEIAGASVLDRWLRKGVRPARGRLTLMFCNLDAFARFDAADPTLSRYVDEDLNRVWDAEVLNGPRSSRELRRARELRPVLDSADLLLDLHSMLWPSDPLVIAGRPEKARPWALSLGIPPLVVADQGHAEGKRMLDYGPFSDPASKCVGLLVEGGPHWERETVSVLQRSVAALLRSSRVISPPMEADSGFPSAGLMPALEEASSELWEVTRTVTAHSRGFTFVEPFRGGTVVPDRGTLLALDGDTELRTPHDECLLVMPSPQVLRGHTAVRLARRVGPPLRSSG